MTADRFEITCDDDVATVTAPGGVTDSFSRNGTSTDRFGYGAIRQQARDLERILPQLHPSGRKLDEIDYARCYIAAVQSEL